MTGNQVYLNGEFMPIDVARVPVLDRGFIFGDGVYEVIPVYADRAFRLPHHLDRLQDSLSAVSITNPYTAEQWSAIIAELVEKNGGGEQSVYMQITRGVAPRDHRFPENTPPTVFLMSNPMESVDPVLIENGIAAVTLTDSRWQNCNIKAIALLPNILLRQQAVDRNAMEAILIRDNEVTEGSASNVFIVKNGVMRTPAKSHCLLPGITRDLVVELAHKHGQPIEEAAISEQDLLSADEVWITSSTKEILAVTRLNDTPVNKGQPGPVFRLMLAHFQDCKALLKSGQPC